MNTFCVVDPFIFPVTLIFPQGKETNMSAGRRSALLTQLSEGNPELSAAPQPDPKAKFLTCDCCERFITFVYFKNIPSKDGSSAFALGELDICFPCQKRFNSSEEGLLLKQDDGSKPLPVTKAGTSLYFMGRAPLPPKACLSSGQRATVDPDEENPSDETQTWDMTEASPFKAQIGQVAVESPKKPRASSTKKKASPKRRSTSAAAKKTATNSDKKTVAEAEEDEVPPKSDASPRIGRPRSSNHCTLLKVEVLETTTCLPIRLIANCKRTERSLLRPRVAGTRQCWKPTSQLPPQVWKWQSPTSLTIQTRHHRGVLSLNWQLEMRLLKR